MFRIGEFSKITQVSIRMLRYYDEIGLLKPAQIDKFTGYRLYSTEQIPILQKIILLRNIEFNVSEILIGLEKWNEKNFVGILENKKREILNTIKLEQERVAKIEIAIKDIENKQIEIHYNIILKYIASYKIISLREIIPDYFCEGELWKTLFKFVKDEKIELLNTTGLSIFYNEEKTDCNIDIEIGLIVKKFGENKNKFIYRQTESVENMACIMVYGSYENIGTAYHFFAIWLEQHHQYKINGPIRQICHIGPFNEKNPENYLTEVQIPVEKQI